MSRSRGRGSHPGERVQSGSGGKKQIEQFVNEVDLMSRAAHRNVLPLTGFCLEMGEMVLVFPLMANGSVEAHLAGENNNNLFLHRCHV